MKRLAILYLENDPINIEWTSRQLQPFSRHFDVHCVESNDDAQKTLQYLESNNQTVALVIAAHHFEFNGSRFLIELEQSPFTSTARKILLSDDQQLDAILEAVNRGRLDQCLTKPFDKQRFQDTLILELTNFVLSSNETDWLHYANILDHQRILKAHIDQKMHSYRSGFIHDFHNLSDSKLAESVIGALHQFFDKNDDTMARRVYSSDHLLTKEGQPNHFLWFITSGEVALYKKDEFGKQREVVRHSKGNIVGGMSFVTGENSFSTAITLSKTEVIKLDRDVFSQVMHSENSLLPLFTNLLLRHFNRRLQRSINTKLQLQKTVESLEIAQQQLVEREKMAILGQLVAGVAHELNNPVAAILRGTETLQQKFDELINLNLSPELHERGIKILSNALTSRPSSTSDIRAKSKSLMSTLNDKQIAKKAVQLHLDDDPSYITELAQDLSNAQKTLTNLEKYHITGSTLRSIKVCSQRIADMVKSLKGYARQDDESIHCVDIREGIEDTLVIFENRLKFHTVEKSYSDIPNIHCSPIALQQVWTNLISNAIDAFPEQGILTISTEVTERNNKEYVVVSFQDNGYGIQEDQLEKIFQLNFTTKKEGNFGLGIGLSICQQILSQHNGWIEATSKINSFTCMQVYLPTQFDQNMKEHPQ